MQNGMFEGHHAEVKELEGLLKQELNDDMLKKVLNDEDDDENAGINKAADANSSLFYDILN